MFYAKIKASKQLPILRRFFGYNGRTLVLTEGETARISNYWDDGCCAYPQAFSVETLKPADDYFNENFTPMPMPYGGMQAGSLKLSPGYGLVEHVYSGQRQYLRVTLHPSEDRSDWIG